MKIYVAPNGAVKDLVNPLEELKPGLVSSRLVFEISTADKNLAAMLRTFIQDLPDELNKPVETKPRKTRGKSIKLPGSKTFPEAENND